MNKQKAFTLIELMITVVIIGILAAVAIPTYKSYIVKTRRADAMGAILSASAAMERYKSRNNFVYTGATFGTSTPATDVFTDRIPATGNDVYYLLSLTSTANTYTIRATPKAGSTQAGDGFLSITNTGVKVWGNHPSGWPDK